MITAVQQGEVYVVKFPYDRNLIYIVKTIPGRRWDPDNKYWTIPVDRLGFLIAQLRGSQYEEMLQIYSAEHINQNAKIDTNPASSIPDIDISKVPLYVEKGKELFSHQKDFMKFAIDRQQRGLTSGFIVADEMGCISGSASIRIHENGKSYRDCTLHNAYRLYSSGVTFKIKSMCNDRFMYMPISNIIDKGIKQVIKIHAGGHELICTPDHELYTPNGWVRADSLRIGDDVFANGDLYKCPICGSSEDIVTSKGAKFEGFCRSCMYKSREGTRYKGDQIYKSINKDGYVMLKGKPIRKSPVYQRCHVLTEYGVYEHHQVWYEHTGHIVDPSVEAIHHKNHIKTDNRFENLELVTLSEHGKIHADASTKHLPQNSAAEFYMCHGVKTWVIPHIVTIDSIEDAGSDHVYDVTIDDPYIHNFIANNFIVHNCGKTLEAMNLALYNKKYNKVKHCLIIACVNSAKYNWIEDIRKHTNCEYVPYLLGSKLKRDGTLSQENGSEDKLKDLMYGHMYGKKDAPELPFFLIMNIEALRMRRDRHYLIRERLAALINKGYIGMVILDEIHRGASPSSMQGKQLLKLKKDTEKAKVEWLPMTGTPIVNKPTDVFTPLKLIGGHDFTSYHLWCQHFCVYGGFGGHDIIGYKNIPELKNMLQGNMIRRLKSEILDLPPKLHTIEYVENTSYQDKLYKEILKDTVAHREEILSALNPMVRLLKLRQVNGSPELVDPNLVVDKSYLSKNSKMQRLVDLVDVIVSSGQKVVIFSNWVESLRTVYKFLALHYKVCCFTGTMKPEEAEKNKKMFIEDPECMIMIGTVAKLGVSHTLTVANNVIFYDLPWNPATMEQAEDRCHRAGTTSTVNIYSIITKDTVDEKVYKLIQDKDGVAKYIVDNQLSFHNNPELFEILFGKNK